MVVIFRIRSDRITETLRSAIIGGKLFHSFNMPNGNILTYVCVCLARFHAGMRIILLQQIWSLFLNTYGPSHRQTHVAHVMDFFHLVRVCVCSTRTRQEMPKRLCFVHWSCIIMCVACRVNTGSHSNNKNITTLCPAWKGMQRFDCVIRLRGEHHFPHNKY